MLASGLQLTVLWFLTACAVPSFAQTSRLFQWAFANDVSVSLYTLLIGDSNCVHCKALSTSLPTCLSLPIIVKSFDPTTNATQGSPPYYMIAFAVGKTPVTTLIGTDENNLSWTITDPVGELNCSLSFSSHFLNIEMVGSELVLSVVDANGSAGGIPPRPFTVIGDFHDI